MKIKLFCLPLLFFLHTQSSLSQCISSYPPQGYASGCTVNPTGSIAITSSSSKICYSGTSTISTLAINGINDTIYINGDITITNMAGIGLNPFIVVNAGKELTVTNQPSNFWTNPSYVNYGTMNIGSSWGNFSGGSLITSGSSATTHITGDLILDGGTAEVDGSVLNVTGLTNLNAMAGGICLKSNAILKTKDLTSNSANKLTVPASSLACVYFTGNATVWNQLTTSILSVVKGVGSTVTGSNWGPHTTVSSGNASSCSVLLPMVMGDFSLQNSGTKVVVDWSTFSEQKSDHFEIERSSDAVNFSTIGTVSASGNSASTKQYSFTDYYPTIGNDFYRIKLLSDDGNPSYSVIKEIEITPSSEMKVIVNNSQNNIKVIMPENSSQSTLRLLDMQGRIIKTVKNTTQEEFVTIETSNIFSGVYIVELITQNSHQAKQVFVSAGK